MNKEQAKERLCAIETEVEKLRRIIDEPEQRTPETGDVWKGFSGSTWLRGESKDTLLNDTEHTHGAGYEASFRLDHTSSTYLGKFDEVYVKASDVREVLSIQDEEGETLEECAEHGTYFATEGCKALVEKLKSIIK
jgi:hypothetical protein